MMYLLGKLPVCPLHNRPQQPKTRRMYKDSLTGLCGRVGRCGRRSLNYFQGLFFPNNTRSLKIFLLLITSDESSAPYLNSGVA
jgi:hypothetical protein